VGIPVRDQDQAIEFYVGKLGFEKAMDVPFGGSRRMAKDHGREIRAHIRDPDGHLIEVGQATGVLG
jgi:catechol 2,3-dioxygenase-like lactoylglutathione lyase family enzyme